MTVPNEPEGLEEKLSPRDARSAGKISDSDRRLEVVVVARRAKMQHAPPLKDVNQPRTERQSRAERREWIVPLTILVVGLAAAVFGFQRTGTPSAESTWEPSPTTTTTTMSEAEKAAAKAKRYQAWGKKPTTSAAPPPATYEPEPTGTYELTTDDQQQLTALRLSWNKESLASQQMICALYETDISSAVDPLTAGGNFSEEAVVSFLIVACA